MTTIRTINETSLFNQATQHRRDPFLPDNLVSLSNLVELPADPSFKVEASSPVLSEQEPAAGSQEQLFVSRIEKLEMEVF